jgi:CDP-6-deoxy-D-xylo-4-hexulose-3-dehydrase
MSRRRDWIHYAGRVYNWKEKYNLIRSALDFQLTAGRFADRFEKQLEEYLTVSNALLVNSGSSANLLALTALGLEPGDEVITVAAAFPTTVAPIIQNNLVPVFVDVDLGTYNAIPDQVEQAIGSRTRAIFLAHTLGNPFDVDRIYALANKHRLWLIEDNCDALGSTYRGCLTGSFGHLSTASFYPAHHITTGEGGCVMTNDEELARTVRSLRDWGRDCSCPPGQSGICGQRFTGQFGALPYGYDHKYVYSHIGYNLKMTEMQAAIGVAQMDKLPSFIRARKRNFAALYEGLKKHEDRLLLPVATEGSDPSWFGFIITVREGAGFTRAELVDHLNRHRIETRYLFGGNLTRQPAFLGIAKRQIGDLKNTGYVMNNSFFIGVYPGIGPKEVDYILSVIDEFMGR